MLPKRNPFGALAHARSLPETHSEHPKDAYTGRPDQGITANTGTGAGGATQWGGGNANHPSRIAGKPPGG